MQLFHGDLYASQFRTTAAMAIVATAFYGFNIALALGCIKFLISQKEFSSRRRYVLTCLYIVAMVAFATWAVVSVNVNVLNAVVSLLVEEGDPPNKFVIAIFDPKMPLALPVTIWGADALLIYRCVILYRLIDKRRRITLYVGLGLIAFTSFGSGLAAYILAATGVSNKGFHELIASGIAPFTIVVNGLVSCLIAGRLIYAHQLLQSSRAEAVHAEKSRKSNPYMTALAICVESSVLIVAGAIAAISRQDFIVVMPQISVLAPFLIIYRVAQGRAEEAVAKLEATLAFHHTQVSQDMS